MSHLKGFSIVLADSKNVYHPGDVIVGHVHLELTEEMKAREIRAEFEGKASCRYKRKDRTCRAREKYAQGSVTLFDREPGQSEDSVIKPGSYTYPFQFQIPPECPSSFEGREGHVRYVIWAIVDRPLKVHHQCFAIITVLSGLDLNHEPSATDLPFVQATNKTRCLCSKAGGGVSINFCLERKGFVPGESIPVKGEISNLGSKTITAVHADLVMTTTFNSRNHQSTCHETVSSFVSDREVEPGESDAWHKEFIPIPPLPPSYLRGCGIIDIKYDVRIRPAFPGLKFGVAASTEVIIGTVPRSKIAKQTHPSGLPPPLTYGQYAFGTCSNISRQTNDEEDHGEDHEEDNVNENSEKPQEASYTPVYAYFDFTKHQGFDRTPR